MPDLSNLSNSKRLLERAAYYAADYSFTDSVRFAQAQADSEQLLELDTVLKVFGYSKNISIVRLESS